MRHVGKLDYFVWCEICRYQCLEKLQHCLVVVVVVGVIVAVVIVVAATAAAV